MDKEELSYGSFVKGQKTEELEVVEVLSYNVSSDVLAKINELNKLNKNQQESQSEEKTTVAAETVSQEDAEENQDTATQESEPDIQQAYAEDGSFDWEKRYQQLESYEKNKKPSAKKTSAKRKQLKKEKKLQKKQAKLDKKQAKQKKSEDKKIFFKTSIGFKLVTIISLLVIISMGTITALVSYFVTADTRVNAEENNLTINKRASADCQYRLESVINASALLFDLGTGNKSELTRSFFERNSDIAAIVFFEQNREIINSKFFTDNSITLGMMDSYILINDKNIRAAKSGTSNITNASPYFSVPMLSIVYTLYANGENQTVMVLFSSQSLADSFSTGSVNASYLVNNDGDVLIHSDMNLILQGHNIKNTYLVEKMIGSSQTGEQLVYVDADGEEYFGAFTKINLVNCGVITQASTQIVLEGIRKTTLQNIYLTLAILSISILVIWIFARSLTAPLKLLTEVTEEINKGDFETPLFDSLKSKRRDEIGVLNRSTKNEREILNTFTKLTNKGVTKAIVLKKIDFEPHLKDIAIFFSDIRGFTAISDGFNNRFGEKSAAHIINFLNEYMQRMVNCIAITGGVVDKFEGDAIMAAWGVLRDDNLDFELLDVTSKEYKEKYEIHQKHHKEDTISAITAAIAMRYALMEYNKAAAAFTAEHENDPQAVYKPHIRIGSGINIGRATVGFMGSNDKMEFTSIGDAVNLASRTESSNKPCGTDLLITQDTYDLLKYEYIRNESNNYTILPENQDKEIVVEKIPVSFEVKGKGKQYFYGVVNMPMLDVEKFFKTTNPDFVVDPDCARAVGPLGPETLSEVRQLLGIPEPDFSGVNLGEEENKIQVSSS